MYYEGLSRYATSTLAVRGGATDAVEPTIVNDYDFVSSGDGKAIPHGICDLSKNEASLHLTLVERQRSR